MRTGPSYVAKRFTCRRIGNTESRNASNHEVVKFSVSLAKEFYVVAWVSPVSQFSGCTTCFADELTAGCAKTQLMHIFPKCCAPKNVFAVSGFVVYDECIAAEYFAEFTFAREK